MVIEHSSGKPPRGDTRLKFVILANQYCFHFYVDGLDFVSWY